MAPLVLLLRGINLGAHKRIGMPELRAALAEAGYERPRTLLASGNVILDTRRRPATEAAAVRKLIADRFGMDVSVVARTRDQLRQVVDGDPFAGVATNGSRYVVAFLDREPDAERLRCLEPFDDVAARGTEIYAWLPDGIAASESYQYLTDRHLGVVTTVRNWNTVLKLLALTE